MLMPMHYPPLANGTFRYGDAPRPLPSPVPGPETGHHAGPAHAHAHAGKHHSTDNTSPALPYATSEGTIGQPALPGHPVPHETLPSTAGRPPGTVAAATIVGGLGLVVVVFLGASLLGLGSGGGTGSAPSGPSLPGAARLPDGLSDLTPGAPFTVDGNFTVVSAPGAPVSGDGSGCQLPPSMSDIGSSTQLTLIGSTGTPMGMAALTYGEGDLSSCSFTFEFTEVTGGEAFYAIELPGRGELVYTEDELRAGVEITLGR